ncbi:MAG: flagellar basal body rod protein FlgB [Alphaproteobacteria bacterium]|nr:flagellar basal body rod protein FlgB [Alphaproteobacteria bacterium]
MSSDVSGLSSLLNLLSKKMAYLTQKQAVLAENVANADTPGYKELAVKAPSFADAMQQANLSMTVTNAHDILPPGMAGVNAQTYQVKNTQMLPNGNNVDLEQQMMEVSKTSIDYQTVAQVYHKVAGLFKIAIKGSSA